MQWVDRKVERPNSFVMQNNSDGTITLIPSPGTIQQVGTPLNAENLNGAIDYSRSKIVTNISAVEGNLQLTTDSYQIAKLSSNTTLVLPNVTKPLDIIIEIKPNANIALTYPSNVKWQGDEPTIISGNIYEIYLGFDGADWIGGWIVYEHIS